MIDRHQADNAHRRDKQTRARGVGRAAILEQDRVDFRPNPKREGFAAKPGSLGAILCLRMETRS